MNKLYKYYKFFVVISTIMTLIISLFIKGENGYTFVFLIPLLYLFYFLFFKRIHKYSRKHSGLFILNVIMFIKYSISILIILLYKDFYTPSIYSVVINSSSFSKAIVYIIMELSVAFFTIELFSDSIYKKSISDKDNVFYDIKLSPLLLLVLIAIGSLIFKYPDSFFPNLRILFRKEVFLGTKDTSIIPVLFNSLKIIVIGYIINKFIVKYQNSNKSKYIVISYIYILVFCFLNIDSSRRSFILPLLLFILITKDIFKEKGKLMLILSIVLLTITFSSVTIYKMFWLYNDNASISYVLKTSLSGIQEYFSNIRPVAIGLETLYNYNRFITFNTFINDFAGSTPFISGFVDQTNRINYFYNLYALGGINTSQIVPMIIVSKAYFGIALSGLLTFIHIILLMIFESNINKKIRNNNYVMKYLNLYLLFTFSSSLNSNTQMIYSRIILNYIIPILILKFNNFIVVRKGKKYGKI